jgi:hypothetical protein
MLMSRQSGPYHANQRDRWLRHDAHLWIRPDAARWVKPAGGAAIKHRQVEAE